MSQNDYIGDTYDITYWYQNDYKSKIYVANNLKLRLK